MRLVQVTDIFPKIKIQTVPSVLGIVETEPDPITVGFMDWFSGWFRSESTVFTRKRRININNLIFKPIESKPITTTDRNHKKKKNINNNISSNKINTKSIEKITIIIINNKINNIRIEDRPLLVVAVVELVSCFKREEGGRVVEAVVALCEEPKIQICRMSARWQ